MALTHERAVELARQAQGLADQIKAFHSLAAEFLRTNSNLAIDWGNATKPSFLREDVNGNIDGGGSIQFSRQQISNLINSLNQVVVLLDAGNPSTGDHMGNINQVATSSVTVRR
jgi:hypothetical protein